jgi:hypothetical protein
MRGALYEKKFNGNLTGEAAQRPVKEIRHLRTKTMRCWNNYQMLLQHWENQLLQTLLPKLNSYVSLG